MNKILWGFYCIILTSVHAGPVSIKNTVPFESEKLLNQSILIHNYNQWAKEKNLPSIPEGLCQGLSVMYALDIVCGTKRLKETSDLLAYSPDRQAYTKQEDQKIEHFFQSTLAAQGNIKWYEDHFSTQTVCASAGLSEEQLRILRQISYYTQTLLTQRTFPPEFKTTKNVIASPVDRKSVSLLTDSTADRDLSSNHVLEKKCSIAFLDPVAPVSCDENEFKAALSEYVAQEAQRECGKRVRPFFSWINTVKKWYAEHFCTPALSKKIRSQVDTLLKGKALRELYAFNSAQLTRDVMSEILKDPMIKISTRVTFPESSVLKNQYYGMFQAQVQEILEYDNSIALIEIDAHYPDRQETDESSTAINHCIVIVRASEKFIFFDPNENRSHFYSELAPLLQKHIQDEYFEADKNGGSPYALWGIKADIEGKKTIEEGGLNTVKLNSLENPQ